MDGYGYFKERLKSGYRNIKDVGLTVGVLTDVKPVTITVVYSEKKLSFTKFLSCVELEGLKEKDIGKVKWLVFISGRDNLCYIICEYNKYYANFYLEEEGEGEE